MSSDKAEKSSARAGEKEGADGEKSAHKVAESTTARRTARQPAQPEGDDKAVKDRWWVDFGDKEKTECAACRSGTGAGGSEVLPRRVLGSSKKRLELG